MREWSAEVVVDEALARRLLRHFEGREAFLDAYGPIGEDQLLRARVLALFLCSTLAVYARHEGLPDIEREGAAGLVRASAH